MSSIEEADLNESLAKASKICRTIRAAITVAVVIFAIGWIAALGASIAGGVSGGRLEDLWLVGYVFVYGALVLLSGREMIKIFSSVVKQRRPFSEEQANRSRFISLLALCLVVLELVFTATASYSVIPEVGYNIGINDAYPADSVNLNVGMLVFSAIMYSLSALFRYAALLQQLSQDTV